MDLISWLTAWFAALTDTLETGFAQITGNPLVGGLVLAALALVAVVAVRETGWTRS